MPPTIKAPTRLIKIQALPCGAYDLRVDCPVGPVKYAALSYCWGGEQVHKTTIERLPAYRRNIRWDNLPKTIQEAIKVTAALDMEYLWVDSICIIQDDDEDKAREIADMPNIYYEATVTVVAATAKAAAEGFLHDRDPQALLEDTFKLPFRCPDGRMGSAYLTRVGELEFGEHVDTRAWTLQEAYLSKRLLRFGNKQCSLVCQCSPSKPRTVDGWKLGQEYDVPHLSNLAFPIRRYPGDDLSAWKAVYKSVFGAEPAYDTRAEETWEGDFFDLWIALVEEYTRRGLTVPGDRPLAISGVADRIAPILSSSYVAGHWEKFLPAELLWYVTASQPKPEAYQGPSWSWTSVNGSVLFRRAQTDASLEVKAVDIQRRTPMASFGAVKRGALRVRGKLLRAQWTGQEVRLFESEARETLIPKAILSYMYWPDTNESNFLENSTVGSGPESGRGGSAAQQFSRVPPTSTQRVDIYFLEVCPPGPETGPGSVGLVLSERSSPSSSSKFARIGLFDFTSYSAVDEPEGVTAEEWQLFLNRRNQVFDTLEPREVVIE